MTNLLILYPDIPASARSYKTYTDDTADTPNEYETHLHRNTLRGERYQNWKVWFTALEQNAVYDLGTISGTDVTKSANFVVISRMDRLRSDVMFMAPIEFNLQSSDDDITYTDEHTVPDIDSATLIGPWENDYAAVFTATSAHRYWRANFIETASTTITPTFNKIYFGTAFDMGRDPEYPESTIIRRTSGDTSFITSSGVKYQGRVQHPTYEINLEWKGVTDSTLSSFMTNIVANRYTTPVFLYTQTFHDPLDGKQLIHCKLESFSYQQEYANWNNIRCTFVEIHG